MTTTLLSPQVPVIQLPNYLEYPEAGVLNKLLFKDKTYQYSLFCLAAKSKISEHTATRNATIHEIAVIHLVSSAVLGAGGIYHSLLGSEVLEQNSTFSGFCCYEWENDGKMTTIIGIH